MPQSNYDTRTFTLTAGVPIALPAARNFLVLSASVDTDLVTVAMGDGNASTDGGKLPRGIRVSTDKKITARLISSVSQSVTLLISDGEVTVDDSRTNFLPSTNAQTFALVAPSARSTVNDLVVGGAANPNGIEVYAISLAMQATVANGGYMSVNDSSSNVLLAVIALPGVLQNMHANTDARAFIPAGRGLRVDIVAAIALQCAYSITLKIL